MTGTRVERSGLKRGCVLPLVLGVGVLAGLCVYTGVTSLDRQRQGVVPISTPALVGTPTITSSATFEPYFTPTIPALTPDEQTKKVCEGLVQLSGHFNRHLEYPMPQGDPLKTPEVVRQVVDWYHNYFDKFSTQNDPVINVLKSIGVKQYSDIIPSTDLDTLNAKVKTGQAGENYVVYVSQAQDLNESLNKTVSDYASLYAKYGYSFDASTFKQELISQLGIQFESNGVVRASMAYYKDGKTGTQEFWFIRGRTVDAYPNGPLKGADRFAVFMPLKFQNGKPLTDVQTGLPDVDGASSIMIDDYTTILTVGWKKFVCSGSSNPIATMTPKPTGVVLPSITATRGGNPPGPTETPRPPRETPRGTATLQPPISVPKATPQPATPVTPETGPSTSTPVFVASPVPTKRPEATVPPATAWPTDAPDTAPTVVRPTAPVTSQSDERYLSLVGPYLTHKQWKNGGAEAFANSVMALLGENK